MQRRVLLRNSSMIGWTKCGTNTTCRSSRKQRLTILWSPLCLIVTTSESRGHGHGYSTKSTRRSTSASTSGSEAVWKLYLACGAFLGGTPMNFLGSSNSRRTMRLFVMNWSIYATKKDSSPIEGQVGQPAIRLKTELVRSRMTPEAGTSSTWCCTIWGLMWTARRYQRQWSSSTNIFLATTITVSLALSLRRLTS